MGNDCLGGFYYERIIIFTDGNIASNIRMRKQSCSPSPHSPNSAVLPSALPFHLALCAYVTPECIMRAYT